MYRSEYWYFGYAGAFVSSLATAQHQVACKCPAGWGQHAKPFYDRRAQWHSSTRLRMVVGEESASCGEWHGRGHTAMWCGLLRAGSGQATKPLQTLSRLVLPVFPWPTRFGGGYVIGPMAIAVVTQV
jgi:ribosomal protein L32